MQAHTGEDEAHTAYGAADGAGDYPRYKHRVICHHPFPREGEWAHSVCAIKKKSLAKMKEVSVKGVFIMLTLVWSGA